MPLLILITLKLYLKINRRKDDIAVLQQAVVIYTEEFGKFTTFIGYYNFIINLI